MGYSSPEAIVYQPMDAIIVSDGYVDNSGNSSSGGIQLPFIPG